MLHLFPLFFQYIMNVIFIVIYSPPTTTHNAAQTPYINPSSDSATSTVTYNSKMWFKRTLASSKCCREFATAVAAVKHPPEWHRALVPMSC